MKTILLAGAIATASRRSGGTDSTTFNEAGLPGIGLSQDPIEYGTYTWHTSLDTYERELVELLIVVAIVGILAAIFYVDSSDVVHVGIRYLVLGAVFSVLGGFPLVGPWLTGFFGGVFAFLGPVVLTTLVMYFVNKYFFAKK